MKTLKDRARKTRKGRAHLEVVVERKSQHQLTKRSFERSSAVSSLNERFTRSEEKWLRLGRTFSYTTPKRNRNGYWTSLVGFLLKQQQSFIHTGCSLE